tara:strand:+ start:295 stop:654 length:360 start_codon:yes stop_codon:yes gene_type:complete
MAKFLKIVSSDANDPETMIGIDQVTHVAAGDAAGANLTTSVTVFYSGGSCTVAYAAEANVGDVLKAFNAALVANPGGLVSTVSRPILTQQAPLAQSGQQGRILITAQPTFVAYTGVTFA